MVIRRLRQLLGNENGAALVVVAMAMVTLLGFIALTTDVGLLFLHKSRVANAVDSAVLAGAQELPWDAATALAKAQDFAGANGVNATEASFEVAMDNRQIQAQANREVSLCFARMLGFNQGTVGARAVARVAPSSSVDYGVVPLSVEKPAGGEWFAYGEEVTLKLGHGDRGWFQCLRLPGNSGASDYERDMKRGYKGTIKIGDIILEETGNMSNPTNRGIDYRITECPHSPPCSFSHFEVDCPRLVIVPVITVYSQLEKTVKVEGFAAIFLEGSGGNGVNNWVKGHFVRLTTTGGVEGSQDYGVYGIKLCE